MARQTQREMVLNYIRSEGHISSWDAYRDLGITQLATRISELKARGHKFRKERIKTTTRFGVKTHYDNYYLIEE
jgi:hypothetical protein